MQDKFVLLDNAGLKKFVIFKFLQPSITGVFLTHNAREAIVVYLLIVVTLMGNFFDDPYLN